MSVLAGIWHFDGTPVDREFLMSVSHQLAEYGPDGEETYFHESIGMVYRPLHTTRESRLEHQPHQSVAGNLISWDGRLDNRDELISRLGQSLRDDRTDVAIISAAFDRWGTNTFRRLVGDWAMAIWNYDKQELVLARDYIGVRQIFYYPSSNRVMWCSHIAPLALCGDRFTLCDDYIAGYLAFYADAHLTPYSEIHSVPPGSFVCIRGQRLRTHRYWSAMPACSIRYRSDGEYVEHYRELFQQSVRRRLRSDSPVLAELSGGFDSSSVVCMADEIMAKESSHTSRVDTFSFHDSTEPEEDDFLYFSTVEVRRKRTGFHVDLHGSGDSFVLENSSFVGTPGPGTRAEVRSALSSIVERFGYRVILSGFGGDQMNGQTLDPRILMADLFLELRWMELFKQLSAWSLLIRKRPWIHLLLQTLVQIVPIPLRARFTNSATNLPWLDRNFARKRRVSARLLEVVDGVWFIRPSARDAMQTIATLSRHLSGSRPSAVEKRYPYLDQNLVEFLTAIPLDQLLRPGERRWLMRRAVADILPPEVFNRTTKARVGRYPCAVMEKHWDRVEQALSSSLAARRGYVSSENLRRALLAMKSGQLPTYVLRLVNAICLEFWLRDVQARGIVDLHLEENVWGTQSIPGPDIAVRRT
jgi:asparagine synthase (glutamine-hydrolysing)